MPLTPADVRSKQFSTTRLRPGYDEEEVDAFLDEVEAELDRLIQENEELRSKLAVLRGGGNPALSSPLSLPHPDTMVPEPPMERPMRRPVKMPLSAPPGTSDQELGRAVAPRGAVASGDDDIGTAARVLSLAQQTADRAIADARREAGETMNRARREADDALTNARRQAKQITDDARAQAEALGREAQERYQQATGSLVQQREELERRVEDLRAFEREYRNRLTAHLERQLRDLDASALLSGDELPGALAFQEPGLPGLATRMSADRRP